MKAIIVVDVNDDTYLEPEADVIIDNGDFHLETKAFLKPMPEKKVIDYETFEEDGQKYAYEVGFNDCVNELVGEEE